MPGPKYSYESAQQSILLPFYRRYLWNPILSALPLTLSPNAMTLFSTFCCATSFLIAATLRESTIAMLIAALLVVAYFTFDNLDGAQARRIGRSSRLGEFLDHWLDTLNNGFIVLGACLAAGLPGLITLGVLSFASLAFFAVQWELRHTDVFRVGRVGDIEGNTTVVLLYCAIAIFGTEALQAEPIPGLPSLSVWMATGVVGQAIWTLYSAITRVSVARADFLPPLFSHLAVAIWAATSSLGVGTYLALAFFLNPVFTARPVCDRLLGRTTPELDWLVVATLTAATTNALVNLADVPDNALGLTLAAGLTLLTIRHGAVTVSRLNNEAGAVDTDQPPIAARQTIADQKELPPAREAESTGLPLAS